MPYAVLATVLSLIAVLETAKVMQSLDKRNEGLYGGALSQER